MKRKKRKLTKAQKQQRRKEFMTIFINGKQKCVRRPPTIDGTDVDEFIRHNADPIWLHQNEMGDLMMELEMESQGRQELPEWPEPPEEAAPPDEEELSDEEKTLQVKPWQNDYDCPDEVPF